MNRLIFLLASAVALLSAPASAQQIPSSYSYIENSQAFGVYWGHLATATGQFDLGPDPGGLLGARYSVEVGGPVFLDGLFSMLSTSRDIIDPRREEGDRSLGQADVRLFSFDARLAFSLTGRRTWRGFSPYLFAGGGIAFDGAKRDDLDQLLLPEDRFDFGTTFTASMGSGLRYQLTQKLMLRGDADLKLWKLSTPTGFDASEKGLERVSESEWVGGWALTIGASWRF
ncbi:MAG: outer membrane beta-barrel protein [Longimicrobiales bacterium]